MSCRRHERPEEKPGPRLAFWSRWILANTLISGTLALLWLLLRSGTNPNRLAYPCQQAALATAKLAFGAPLVAAVLAGRHRVLRALRTPVGIVATAAALVLATGFGGYRLWASEYRGPKPETRADYRAEVFHVTGCPQDPTGDRFVGLDNLLASMGDAGLKLYDSATLSLTSGPGGIIAPDDVVLVKINYQWDERGGTSTDLLRGVIRRIVDHPDGFTGQVVVCENAQFNSTSGFDRPLNNAQSQSQSPFDVVSVFQLQGHDVSLYDWTPTRYTQVQEYSTGDMADGYVVGAYDAALHGRVSYPKFRTSSGKFVSLRYGVWDDVAGAYDRDKLKFVNLPVLKSHHATYGATASVKHYMGVVTRELSTSSHAAIQYGLLGALLGDIRPADLNILDAIWINANPYSGPWTTYAEATRRDELVASVDPVALDLFAVKNILIPGFLSNGYSPPWPSPSADPDLPGSAFRTYLDNSMYQILDAGYDATNDLTRIDVITGSGAAGDFDADSDVDEADRLQFLACFTGPGGGPVGPGCEAGDFDGDGDVDCDDWNRFRFVWTGVGDPEPLPTCDTAVAVAPGAGGSIVQTSLGRAFPNPTAAASRIEFTLGSEAPVSLRVIDVTGHVVRTLVDGDRNSGHHVATWDGRNGDGLRVAGGVYFVRLETPGFADTRRIVRLE